jgi:hypothetical protein
VWGELGIGKGYKNKKIKNEIKLDFGSLSCEFDVNKQ